MEEADWWRVFDRMDRMDRMAELAGFDRNQCIAPAPEPGQNPSCKSCSSCPPFSEQAVDERSGGRPTQHHGQAEEKQRGQERDQPELFILFQEEEKLSDNARRRLPARALEGAKLFFVHVGAKIVGNIARARRAFSRPASNWVRSDRSPCLTRSVPGP